MLNTKFFKSTIEFSHCPRYQSFKKVPLDSFSLIFRNDLGDYELLKKPEHKQKNVIMDRWEESYVKSFFLNIWDFQKLTMSPWFSEHEES